MAHFKVAGPPASDDLAPAHACQTHRDDDDAACAREKESSYNAIMNRAHNRARNKSQPLKFSLLQ